jgi:hypothetical protein
LKRAKRLKDKRFQRQIDTRNWMASQKPPSVAGLLNTQPMMPIQNVVDFSTFVARTMDNKA